MRAAMDSQEQVMHSVERVLRGLAGDRFYGSVEIKFEAGKPVLLRKTETIKPTEPSYGNNRGTNEHSTS
jgi:hypothetical protein